MERRLAAEWVVIRGNTMSGSEGNKGYARGDQSGRPSPKSMPREELLREMGDAVVDSKTMAELQELQRRSGEPVLPGDDLETVLKDPERYAAARKRTAITAPQIDTSDPEPDFTLDDLPETQDADDDQEGQEAPETQEPPDEVEKRFQEFQTRANAEMEIRNRALEQALQKYQKPAEQEKPEQQQVPDFMQWTPQQLQQLYGEDPIAAQIIHQQQTTYRQQEQINFMLRERDQERASHTGQRFDDAFKALKAQYPDAEEHLKQVYPPEFMQLARKESVNSRNTNADFNAWFEQVYAVALLRSGKVRTQRQDDLTQKRSEKRQEAIKKTAAVSSGGQPHQSPAHKSSDRSMRGGRNEMLAEMRQLGFK